MATDRGADVVRRDGKAFARFQWESWSLPATSEGKEKHFTRSYERHVLAGIGHFPTREALDRVSELLMGFLRRAAV
jgi:hypothetical protein